MTTATIDHRVNLSARLHAPIVIPGCGEHDGKTIPRRFHLSPDGEAAAELSSGRTCIFADDKSLFFPRNAPQLSVYLCLKGKHVASMASWFCQPVCIPYFPSRINIMRFLTFLAILTVVASALGVSKPQMGEEITHLIDLPIQKSKSTSYSLTCPFFQYRLELVEHVQATYQPDPD